MSALIYAAAFIGPFVQEDAAVIAAVSALAHPDMRAMVDGRLVVVSMLVGLIVSDLWKYGLGRAAKTHAWAQTFAQKPGVALVQSKLLAHPGKTLLIARFVPGTRIPAYIAAGFFEVGFVRFAAWIIVTACAYTFVMWAFIATIGEVAGKSGQLWVAGGMIGALCLWMAVSFVRTQIASKSSTQTDAQSHNAS